MKIYSFDYTGEASKNTDLKIIAAVRSYLDEHSSSSSNTADISVHRDEYGKPHIIGCENIYVSVTHAENLMLVAVSEREIGIDAEHIDRNVRNFYSLAKRYFTKEERDFLGDGFTKDDFLHMWVKKEALSKLIGEGIPCMKKTSVFDKRFSFSKHSEYYGFIVYSVKFEE